MKLVEILARELSEWPDSYPYIAQDYEGLEFQIAAYATKPVYSHGEWGTNGELELEDYMYPMECNDPATDHATAIVTREMWEAERAWHHMKSQSSNLGAPTVCMQQVSSFALNPLTNRDRIRAIDAQLAGLTAERAERIAELAAEGFALLPVVDVVDMEDWRNWQAGDMLEVMHDDESAHGNEAKKGAILKIERIDQDSDEMPFKCSPEFKGAWPNINCLKFHSRPKP